MSISVAKPGVIPAALAFLAIYNPSLGQTDATIGEQLVYYHSTTDNPGSYPRAAQAHHDTDHEQKNEKLRQVGFAQGMAQFARTFSDGQAVDSIETEKSRILLRELEVGWWLLASVNLTRIISPSEPKANNNPPQDDPKTNIEYSAREVSPTALLLEQVMQAHEVFLLHHAQTLTELFSRLQRQKFCVILKRFWDDFVWKWDVLLHGNPAMDIFGGLKLAAGGELGIGVGEEEWGSGEREVLEGFIGRTDGLVDLIVSRFGEAAVVADADIGSVPAKPSQPSLQPVDWHLGQDPRPSDGVIFSGIGAIARPSVKHISRWVECLFKFGESAYGVRDNPVAINRRRPNKTGGISPSRDRRSSQVVATESAKGRSSDFGIPAPIIGKHKVGRSQQQEALSKLIACDELQNRQSTAASTKGEHTFGTDTIMKYMTFGIYGSGLGASLVGSSERPLNGQSTTIKRTATTLITSPGYFLVGLRGELDEENESEDRAKKAQASRIVLRTLVVEQARKESTHPESNALQDFDETYQVSHDRLRVVVYVNRPFIFTFLFELQTDSLVMPSFYRSLHHQLGPLQRPLLNSTSPSRVSERLLAASAPKSTVTTRSSQPIYDLVYDPYNLTVHTTIPNIPEPGSAPTSATAGGTSWTRVDALSVHSHILNTHSSTRRHQSEMERTCKSNRGWWMVWMRLPHVAASQQVERMVYREAFLLRKASDYGTPTGKASSGVWGRATSASSAGNGEGLSRLAEGIGIDARQYIESLVGLNR
ncbi:MAG: hypothetical protein Q9209_006677 [Squamulea sp. 1 TL-2023]